MTEVATTSTIIYSDEEKARKMLEGKTLSEIYTFMTNNNCLPTNLLWWDEEQWKTQEEYEEAMRQDHINRLSRVIKFKKSSVGNES
jgi:hypothetical protein